MIRQRLLDNLTSLSKGHGAAVLVGLSLAVISVLIGLSLAWIGPIYTTALLIALAGAVWVISGLENALWSIIAIVVLLPYAALPVKIVVTPTFLDLAFAAFFFLYVGEWMTGMRRRLAATPIHPFVILFIALSVFSFVAGLRYAGPTSTVIRRFAELLMSMTFSLVLVDVLKQHRDLQRMALVVMGAGLLVAILAIGLWLMPDTLAESVLRRLSVIGYPDAGIIRYVEENPDLPERAIATSADPNALGGLLVMLAAFVAPQAITQHPLTGRRWHAWIALALLSAALILTLSRGSLLAFGAALFFIAALRYRRLLLLMILAGGLLLVLPWTQFYVTRLAEGFQLADLATQMRLGEYADALTLIGRYPLLGVGFAGTPDIDLYLGVASVYLTIASNMGMVGLLAFVVLMAAVFAYAWRAYSHSSIHPIMRPILLGLMASLVGALANGVFDHYFFNLAFHPAVTALWTFVGMTLAASRITLEAGDRGSGFELPTHA